MEGDSAFSGAFEVKDPFQFLEDDHRKVEELFDKLEEEEDESVEVRQDIVSQIQEALALHAEIEETYVYPLLEEKEETEALAEEGEAEHAKIKELLAELEQLSPEDGEWSDTLMELRECVERHVAEEEGDLFPKARTELSGSQQEMLAQSITAFLRETA